MAAAGAPSTNPILKGMITPLTEHLGLSLPDLAAAWPHKTIGELLNWAVPHAARTISPATACAPPERALAESSDRVAKAARFLWSKTEYKDLTLKSLQCEGGNPRRALEAMSRIQAESYAEFKKTAGAAFAAEAARLGFAAEDLAAALPDVPLSVWAGWALSRNHYKSWKPGEKALTYLQSEAPASLLTACPWLGAFNLGDFATEGLNPDRLRRRIEADRGQLRPFFQALGSEWKKQQLPLIREVEKDLKTSHLECARYTRDTTVTVQFQKLARIVNQMKRLLDAWDQLLLPEALKRYDCERLIYETVFIAWQYRTTILQEALYVPDLKSSIKSAPHESASKSDYKDLANRRACIVEQALCQLAERVQAEEVDPEARIDDPFAELRFLQAALELKGEPTGAPLDRDVRAIATHLQQDLRKLDLNWTSKIASQLKQADFDKAQVPLDLSFVGLEEALWSAGTCKPIDFTTASRKIFYEALAAQIKKPLSRKGLLDPAQIQAQYAPLFASEFTRHASEFARKIVGKSKIVFAPVRAIKFHLEAFHACALDLAGAGSVLALEARAWECVQTPEEAFEQTFPELLEPPPERRRSPKAVPMARSGAGAAPVEEEEEVLELSPPLPEVSTDPAYLLSLALQLRGTPVSRNAQLHLQELLLARELMLANPQTTLFAAHSLSLLFDQALKIGLPPGDSRQHQHNLLELVSGTPFEDHPLLKAYRMGSIVARFPEQTPAYHTRGTAYYESALRISRGLPPQEALNRQIQTEIDQGLALMQQLLSLPEAPLPIKEAVPSPLAPPLLAHVSKLEASLQAAQDKLQSELARTSSPVLLDALYHLRRIQQALDLSKQFSQTRYLGFISAICIESLAHCFELIALEKTGEFNHHNLTRYAESLRSFTSEIAPFDVRKSIAYPHSFSFGTTHAKLVHQLRCLVTEEEGFIPAGYTGPSPAIAHATFFKALQEGLSLLVPWMEAWEL